MTGPLPRSKPSVSEAAAEPPIDPDHERRQSFQLACEIHLDQVWRQLRAMGVPFDYLDDATQEVFLIAFGKLTSFDGEAKLSTWLYAITYRVGCNYRRRARRESVDELLEGSHASQLLNPEQSLAERRAAAMVQRFCDRLSKKLRDVFVLCLLEGQPARDVAELLGTTENTIYSRIRLAREAFRIELERQETEAS